MNLGRGKRPFALARDVAVVIHYLYLATSGVGVGFFLYPLGLRPWLEGDYLVGVPLLR
jgi:hypothetical protein